MNITNLNSDIKIESFQESLSGISRNYENFNKLSGVVLTGTVDVTIGNNTITYPFTDVAGNTYASFEYGDEGIKNSSVIKVDATSGSCNIILDL